MRIEMAISLLLRSAGIILFGVMSVSGCNYSPMGKTAAPSLPVVLVEDKSAVLATIRDDEKPFSEDFRIAFAGKGGGVAYISKKGDKLYVVHNARPGRLYEGIGDVSLSPDGRRIVYTAIAEGKWRVVVDGKEEDTFDVFERPKFSPDGKHVACQGRKGDLWHLVVDGKMNAGAKTRYPEYAFSGDSAHIVYLDKFGEKHKGSLVVSDIAFKSKQIIDAAATSMTLNDDRTAVAAVSKDSADKESVIQIDLAKPDAITRGAAYDKVQWLGFAPKGRALAYVGERQGRMYGVFNGQEELLPEGVTPVTLVINQAGKSVGVLMSANNTIYLYEMFRNSGRKGNAYDEAEWLVYSSDGAVSALAARKGKSWSVVVNGKDGPKFDRVVSPKFSSDGKYLVYRARKDGKRFVVVADASGKVLRQHSAYEQVFDVQFTSDGKSAAYGVKDGNKLIWKVEKLEK